MKRIFVLFLAVMMVMTMFAGCGAHDETAFEPEINSQEQENQKQNNPMNPNQNAQTQYIKNGKFDYIETFPLHYDTNCGEVCFNYYIPTVNAVIEEFKALYPDVPKTTIRNVVLGVAYIENVDWAAKGERDLQNGDVVTVALSFIQANLDLWNEYFGDVELVLEATHTITAEGLEE